MILLAPNIVNFLNNCLLKSHIDYRKYIILLILFKNMAFKKEKIILMKFYILHKI